MVITVVEAAWCEADSRSFSTRLLYKKSSLGIQHRLVTCWQWAWGELWRSLPGGLPLSQMWQHWPAPSACTQGPGPGPCCSHKGLSDLEAIAAIPAGDRLAITSTVVPGGLRLWVYSRGQLGSKRLASGAAVRSLRVPATAAWSIRTLASLPLETVQGAHASCWYFKVG